MILAAFPILDRRVVRSAAAPEAGRQRTIELALGLRPRRHRRARSPAGRSG